jgi:hypothetical protein
MSSPPTSTPQQLGRPLRRLSTPTAAFSIHVDRKTPPGVFRSMVAEADGIPNVHFLPRHGSHWAGFGHVRATLKGLADVLERRVPFDYVVLLTAQDYPCAPRLTSSVTSPPPAVARSCEAVRPKVRCVCRRVDPRCAADERARS